VGKIPDGGGWGTKHGVPPITPHQFTTTLLTVEQMRGQHHVGRKDLPEGVSVA